MTILDGAAGYYAQPDPYETYILEGDMVEIFAGWPTGYHFTGWTTADGVVFDDEYDYYAYFTMPANNVTVTANWAPLPLFGDTVVENTEYPMIWKIEGDDTDIIEYFEIFFCDNSYDEVYYGGGTDWVVYISAVDPEDAGFIDWEVFDNTSFDFTDFPFDEFWIALEFTGASLTPSMHHLEIEMYDENDKEIDLLYSIDFTTVTV